MALIYNAEDFEALTLPDIGFYMNRMIPKMGVTLLHGKYGAWKTAIGLNIAKGIASGKPLWGMAVESTKVLFLECDTPLVGIQPRAKTLGFSGLPVHFSPAYPGLDVVNPKRDEWNLTRYETLHAKHLEEKYGMVVVDSLRTIHSMSEKEGETAKEVYLSLARLFPEAVVLLIHHDRKTYRQDNKPTKYQTYEDQEIDSESFMGSQRWIDLATTSLKIAKHGNDGIVIKQTKSQVGLIATDIFLKPNGDGVTLDLPVLLDDNKIAAAVTTLKNPKNVGDIDRQLAKHFGVSARYLRDFRIAWEDRNGYIPCRSRS